MVVWQGTRRPPAMNPAIEPAIEPEIESAISWQDLSYLFDLNAIQVSIESNNNRKSCP